MNDDAFDKAMAYHAWLTQQHGLSENPPGIVTAFAALEERGRQINLKIQDEYTAQNKALEARIAALEAALIKVSELNMRVTVFEAEIADDIEEIKADLALVTHAQKADTERLVKQRAVNEAFLAWMVWTNKRDYVPKNFIDALREALES